MEIIQEVGFKDKLRAFISEASGISDIEDSTELFSTGIVNSLFAIQLMMFIEKTSGSQISMEELDIDNFNSIASICAFVENK